MSRTRSPRSIAPVEAGQLEGYANPINTAESMGGLCPADEVVIARVYEEVRAAGHFVKPRNLRRLYRWFLANAQTDWDFGGWVLTYLSHCGAVSRSVPVDSMVGERVARSLT